MQVVHVLGDDADAPAGLFLEAGQGQVGGVGLHGAGLGAALVVKVKHQSRVAGKALGRGHVFHAVVFPQPIGVAERADARLGRDAGPGEHNEVFHLFRGEMGG